MTGARSTKQLSIGVTRPGHSPGPSPSRIAWYSALVQTVHSETQPPCQFRWLLNIQTLAATKPDIPRHGLASAARRNPHKPISRFRPHLVLQKVVQGLNRQNRQGNRKFRANPLFQNIDESVGFRRQKLLEIVTNQRGTQSPYDRHPTGVQRCPGNSVRARRRR